MTTDLKFPSNEGKEIDFTPGFTAQEKKYLSRTPRAERNLTQYALLALAILTVLLGGMLVERYVIDPMLAPESVKTAELEHIDEDFYHCLSIKEGMKVRGAAHEEIAKHCMRFGVIL